MEKTTERTLFVAELGRHGDGIAELDGNRIFVPFSLAGETVRAEVRGNRAEVVEIIEASPLRVEPVCKYFGRCGGCAVQHMAGGPYRDWKRGVVETALANRGVEAVVEPLIEAHGKGRRRVGLHVEFSNRRARAGFMQAHSHKLVEVDACPIVAPQLADATAVARQLAMALSGRSKPLEVQLTVSESGLDCVIRGAGELDISDRMNLSDCADNHDLARVSVDGEPVLERRQPVLTFGPASLRLPPGGFLQATKAGEDALSGLVMEAVGKGGRVADLYCGVGPFALRMATASAVLAVDGDAAAIAALSHAARRTSGIKPLAAEVRDLSLNPLHAGELNGFDAVVFDPPRGGAEAQAGEIANSRLKTAVAVSCNPATFARDASILIEGGFRLEKTTPVDQFLYAGHVEIVGVFRR